MREQLVTITNQDTAPADVSGWTIRDVGGNTFTFPAGTMLAAGASVSVRSGSTPPRPGEFGWTSSNIWNNAGDTATLATPSGQAVSSKTAP